MTNQAAQTMPELPASRGYLSLYHSGGVAQVNGYTADQMHQYARDYAAMLAAATAASGGERVPLSERLYRGPAHDTSVRERGMEPQATPESIPATAASVSERARALLAASYRESGDKAQALDVERRIPYVHHAIALRALEQALTQQRWHGTTGSMEQAEKATFAPCDCGCGRSCCAMCGNDVGFLTPQPSADAVRELVKRWRDRALDPTNRGFDNACIKCADELESLLSAASDHQQNAAQGGGGE